MVGYIITRKLTDEERAELVQKMEKLGAEYAPALAGQPPMFPPPNIIASGRLDGWDIRGDVATYWANGMPVTSHRTDNQSDAALVPPDLWAAITEHFDGDARVNMLAIAFDESRYALGAANNSAIEDSYGVFQVNVRAWPDYIVAERQSYDAQASYARRIFNVQGYGAWFNSAHATGAL